MAGSGDDDAEDEGREGEGEEEPGSEGDAREDAEGNDDEEEQGAERLDELVYPPVDEEQLATLIDFGFPEVRLTPHEIT